MINTFAHALDRPNSNDFTAAAAFGGGKPMFNADACRRQRRLTRACRAARQHVVVVPCTRSAPCAGAKQ
eukprot:6595663-Lingulodinium_polyedra.AAC.1